MPQGAFSLQHLMYLCDKQYCLVLLRHLESKAHTIKVLTNLADGLERLVATYLSDGLQKLHKALALYQNSYGVSTTLHIARKGEQQTLKCESPIGWIKGILAIETLAVDLSTEGLVLLESELRIATLDAHLGVVLLQLILHALSSHCSTGLSLCIVAGKGTPWLTVLPDAIEVGFCEFIQSKHIP